MTDYKRSCDSAFGYELALRAARANVEEYTKDVNEELRAKIADLWTGSGKMKEKFQAESGKGIRHHRMAFTFEEQDLTIAEVRAALPEELQEAAKCSDLRVVKNDYSEPIEYVISMDVQTMSNLIFEKLLAAHEEEKEEQKKRKREAEAEAEAESEAESEVKREEKAVKREADAPTWGLFRWGQDLTGYYVKVAVNDRTEPVIAEVLSDIGEKDINVRFWDTEDDPKMAKKTVAITDRVAIQLVLLQGLRVKFKNAFYEDKRETHGVVYQDKGDKTVVVHWTRPENACFPAWRSDVKRTDIIEVTGGTPTDRYVSPDKSCVGN